MPAGIPLDRRGIRYGDQERAEAGFEDFQSLEFEFDCEDGMGPSFLFFLSFSFSHLSSPILPPLRPNPQTHPAHIEPMALTPRPDVKCRRGRLNPGGNRRRDLHRPLQRVRRGLAAALRAR